MEQEHSVKQEAQMPCNCPICKGQCPKCRMEGCGMCPYCMQTRCPLCPMCAAQRESFIGQETMQKTMNMMTFDRIILLLILILVGYIAWSHYNEKH